MTDRQTTHATGCWDFGPRRYECAVGQIGRDEALLRKALEALEFVRSIDSLGMVTDGTAKKAIAALRERLGEKP